MAETPLREKALQRRKRHGEYEKQAARSRADGSPLSIYIMRLAASTTHILIRKYCFEGLAE
jgi:hypothetical protein